MSPSHFNIPEFAPRFNKGGLPSQEAEGAGLIETNLMSLESYVRDLQSALYLFDFTAINQNAARQVMQGNAHAANFLEQSNGWQFLAARDGAMTIYHFATTLSGINETVAELSEFKTLMNREKMKSANKMLSEKFPNFGEVRHAVAHVADKVKNPRKFKTHSFSGSIDSRAIKAENVSGLTISNMLVDRQFTNTWNGKLLTYELSQTTIDHLNCVRKEVWEAFRDAEQVTHANAKIARETVRTTSSESAEPSI